MKNVDHLPLANGWNVNFIKRHGIEEIPDWWAFLAETFGALSYLSLFFIFVSLLVGYSRQMSSFYFFYERIVGEKMKNPYKPAVFFVFAWLAVSILSFFISLTAVYFYKHGLIIAILCAIGGLSAVAIVYYLALRVCDDEPVRGAAAPWSFSKVSTQISSRPQHEALSAPGDGAILLSSRASGSQGVVPVADAEKDDERELKEAMSLFGLCEGFSKEELKSRYREMLKKVHGDEGLVTHVRSRHDFLLKRCS